MKRANIASRQQMTTVNLLKKHFKQLLYWTASNWHYILIQLDTTAISNQIKYYLTKDSGNFLEMQYGFYKYALLADLLRLVAERAFTKNLTKAGTCLFGASLWKIIKVLWLVKCSSKFVFTDRRSWNSKCPWLRYALVFELTG